ncbi:MAG TPA: EVE domain-containing protein [Burkholderiales bacterium]|nr:EVE domain-containing protein [Burkholderiales bacterium]
MRYWLMKSEPEEFSIDDLASAPGQSTPWYGVRNYQARNFMRDGMRVGDRAFFYHSSCPVPGIAGVVEVSSAAYPDASQFDRKSEYYDAQSKRAEPRWVNVDVKLVKKSRLVPLAELRAHAELAGMRLLQRGSRLSITPVSTEEWRFITTRLMKERL